MNNEALTGKHSALLSCFVLKTIPSPEEQGDPAWLPEAREDELERLRSGTQVQQVAVRVISPCSPPFYTHLRCRCDPSSSYS